MNTIDDIEQRLQRELARRKQETSIYNKKVEEVVKNNEKIREVREKIDRAYLNKYHALQIGEKQSRELEKLHENTELERQALQKKKEAEIDRQNRGFEERCKREGYRRTLEEQMSGKRLDLTSTLKEKVVRRQEIEDTMTKLLEEERRKIEAVKTKKEHLLKLFEGAIEEKNKVRQDQKKQEEEVNRKYIEFVSNKENRENENKKKRSELDEAKNQIYEKVRLDQEKRLKEQQELDLLKEQLRNEEVKLNERRQRENDELKKKKMREDIAKWEHEDKLFKERKKFEENQLEQSFKEKMMEEFAKKEKIEQMNQNKKRLKVIELKKEVERLWVEKKRVLDQQEEEEMILIEKIRRKQAEENSLVEEQKKRLVKENLPYIEDFCSKGLYKYL